MAAAVIWYIVGGAERRQHHETVTALAGVYYRVHCSACDQTTEMAAADYVGELTANGSRCPHCGEDRAWQVGLAGGDPEQFRAEVEAMTSVGEVQDEIEITDEEIAKVREELSVGSNDPTRMEALRREEAKLDAKLQLLHARWSHILAPESVNDSP